MFLSVCLSVYKRTPLMTRSEFSVIRLFCRLWFAVCSLHIRTVHAHCFQAAPKSRQFQAYANSEDSDQHARLQRLITDFNIHCTVELQWLEH